MLPPRIRRLILFFIINIIELFHCLALGCVFPSNGVIPTINYLLFRDILNHEVLIKHIHASAMVEGRLEDVLHKVILTWKFKEYKLVKHKAVPFQSKGSGMCMISK